MSGGLPPCTAVESSGARLSPPDVYLTLTFGYFSLKPLITAWNAFCSSPAQIAIVESEPVTSSLPPPLLLLPPPPPQDAAPKASATASAARTDRYFMLELLPQGLPVFSIPSLLLVDAFAGLEIEQVHRRGVDRDVDHVAVPDARAWPEPADHHGLACLFSSRLDRAFLPHVAGELAHVLRQR